MLFLRISCALLTFCFAIVAAVEITRADPITIQNDALQSGEQAHFQGGFTATDIGAAVFTLPVGVDAFTIQQVQILFLAPNEQALHTFVNVHLYCSGLPVPGTPAETMDGVGILPGYLNSVSVAAQDWTVHRDDGPFAIGIEYLWAVEGTITANTGHLSSDHHGCTSGKNIAYDHVSATWQDACAHAAPGNFVVRLVGQSFAKKSPFADADHDGDIDFNDFGAFQRCYTGDFETSTDAACLTKFDCDRDGHVSGSDLTQFMNCATRAGVPANPNCGQCLPSAQCVSGSPALFKSGQLDPAPHQNLVWIAWGSVASVTLNPLSAGLVHLGTKAQLTAAKTQFITHGRQINFEELSRVQSSLIYLRDAYGATDAFALQAAQELIAANYGTNNTLVHIVDHLNNPVGLVANQISGTPQIWIDDRWLNAFYSPDILAMLLFAQWQHLHQPGAWTEGQMQERFMQFRHDHGLETLRPEISHGAPEGIAN